MHAESGQVFRINKRPHLREVPRGENDSPEAKKAALAKKIKDIRSALAARSVPDEEAWRLISEYLTTETKVDMARLTHEGSDVDSTGTPLDLVKAFLIGKRAVHRDLIAISAKGSVPETRRAELAEEAKRLPLLHGDINRQLSANANNETVKTQVQALRIVESLLVSSPQAEAYIGYMARSHRERIPWIPPNLRS